MTDLDIIKECRQTGRTRTTTKNLLEKAYYEQMTNEIDISTVGQHAKVLIEGDTVTIMGVKYQKVEEAINEILKLDEEYGHIPDGFLLNPEEIEELRKSKRELTAYAQQKLHKLKAKQQVEKIVEATMEHTLRPKGGNRERVLASAFRTLLEQCGYGQDGLLVVNIRDILGIIETLEELAQGHPQDAPDAL